VGMTTEMPTFLEQLTKFQHISIPSKIRKSAVYGTPFHSNTWRFATALNGAVESVALLVMDGTDGGKH
jgi:hypothetical protein